MPKSGELMMLGKESTLVCLILGYYLSYFQISYQQVQLININVFKITMETMESQWGRTLKDYWNVATLPLV